MVEENDVYRIPAGQKLIVSEIRESEVVLLNDKGMQKVFTKRKLTSLVTNRHLVPEEDYEKVVREELESEGPPAWIDSKI